MTKEKVAIKVELSKTFSTRALIEGKILKKLQNFEGIPKLHFCGTEGDYNVLVLELLGPNLEDIMSYVQKRLSLKSVLMISDQLIQRMESIHNRGFLHRDIKSDNFLIGSGANMNKVYAIDFGLAKRFVHPHTAEHIIMKKHKGLIGTARFASINAHLGLEQGRRDDLQAVGNLIIYLAKGTLPWQNIKAKTKMQKYKKIFDMKDSYTPEALADGLPEEFTQYLSYVKRMEFEEKPDYNLLRGLFHSVLGKLCLQYDLMFDWMIPDKQRQSLRKRIKKKVEKQVLMEKSPKKEEIQQSILSSQILNEQEEMSKINQQIFQTSTNDMNAPQTSATIHLKNDDQFFNLQDHIFEKPYMKKENEILPEILEKNEDAVSRQNSDIQVLQLQNKFLSDAQLKLVKGYSEITPVKSKLSRKVKHRALSFKKDRSRFNSNNLNIPDSGLIKLKDMQQSDLQLDDKFQDVEEDLDEQNNNLGHYQFNIKSSKLQAEKAGTMTPSPVKRRLMVDQKSMTFNDVSFNFGSPQNFQQQNQFVQNQVKQNRQLGKSCDNNMIKSRQITQMPQIINVKTKQADSSMNTEYNESSSYVGQLKKIRKQMALQRQQNHQQQIEREQLEDHNFQNTSSEEENENARKELSATRKNANDQDRQRDIIAIHDFIKNERLLCQQLKQSKEEQDKYSIVTPSRLATVKNLLNEQVIKRFEIQANDKSNEQNDEELSSSSEEESQENQTINEEINNQPKSCKIF